VRRNVVWALIQKDILLEKKEQSMISQSLLFMVATVFTIYLLKKDLNDNQLFSVFYWISVVFGGFQLCAKSFSNESQERVLWLKQYVSPLEFIFSKLIFNALFLTILAFLAFAAFCIVFSYSPLEANHLFLLAAIVLGAVNLSAVLTFVGGIGHSAGSALGLTAILGFPIILPGLLFSTRLFFYALGDISSSVNAPYAYALLALNVLTILLVSVLFPYLWRE
jgi:heme exporter protein B